MNELLAKQHEARYRLRYPLLQRLATSLDEQSGALLKGVEHIDRLYFRAKDPTSFGKKSVATDNNGKPKYASPFEDIEDQVAGRVLVFFRRDIDIVVSKLCDGFNRAQLLRKEPGRHDAFAYESIHLVFIIPPHLFPDGWEALGTRPTTFEMQVRTLFMHAWAEPEHDIAYKAKIPLSQEEKRKLAWAAAGAWGGDEIFEQVLESLSLRIDDQK
jgi:putative GTP pyrophosphokinase